MEKPSRTGRLACKVVRLSTSLPVFGKQLQNGELRKKLEEREPKWHCPPPLQQFAIPMDTFSMEFLVKRQQAGEETEDEELEQALARYREKGVILQLHGGGYYGAMRNKYREFAGLYNEVSGDMAVLTIDYRVAPEHPYPAALEDAVEAYRWLLQHFEPERIFVVGDSAGGGLALALVLWLKDHRVELPRAIVTMSAWTDLTKSGESYKENFEKDPLFGRNPDSLVYKEGYYKGQDPRNPYISPVEGDFSGFPPMLMQVGEYEMLLSDTRQVAQKAREQGVRVYEHMYPGMFHVFQMGSLMYPESRQAWVEIGRFLRRFQKKGIVVSKPREVPGD